MSDNLSELLGRKSLDSNLFDKLGQIAKPEGAPNNEELDIEFQHKMNIYLEESDPTYIQAMQYAVAS